MRQFLLHRMGDVILVVDTTGVGIKAKSVPAQQFKSWPEAEQYFLSQGTPPPETLVAVHEALDRVGNAILSF